MARPGRRNRLSSPAPERALVPVLVLAMAATVCIGCSGGDGPAQVGDGSADAPAELAIRSSDTSVVDGTSPGREPQAARSAGSSTWTGYEVVVGQATVAQMVARARPDDAALAVARLENPTTAGGPLVFALVEPTTPPPEQEWVEVQLPVRPNGTTGWVHLDQLSLTVNPFRIDIDVSEFKLNVYRRGDLWLSTEVAIGTGATPTPRGDFYITELLRPPNPDGLYGPYAFGLSGYSETLTSFNGGDGVIGIHGTNEPEKLGTEVSHGCVRLANDVITELASVIPLGTPVRIVD